MSVFDIRPYEARDEGFVYDTWMKSFRRSHFRGPFPTDIYYDACRRSIDRVVGPRARWGCRTLVAYSPEDAGTNFDIYGYLCVEGGFDRPLVHYVYTKEPFRQAKKRKLLPFGIAQRLFEEAGVDGSFYFTFRSTMYNDVCESLYRNGLFRPGLLWEEKPEQELGHDGRPKLIVPGGEERRARRRRTGDKSRRKMEVFYGNASRD